MAAHEPKAQREADALALRDRLAAELAADQRVDVATDAEPLGEGDSDPVGRLNVGRFDRHGVVDPDAGFAAEPAVDADNTGTVVLGVPRPDTGASGAIVAVNPNEVATRKIELVGGNAVDRGQSAAGVLLFNRFDG